jgi:hypothetical protein
MAKDKALIGAAGEYYVAFRLLARRYTVALTPRGTTSIDMIVANPETGKSITIQTKTGENAFVRSKDLWNWRVGKLRKPHASFFYMFVDLKNDPSQTPDVFIVPSGKLRSLLTVYPKGVDPESPEVRDIWCCIYEENVPRYRNKWEIIERALA